MGKAQKDVSRKKKTLKGYGRGESEETPVRLFNKKLVPVYQILVYLMIGSLVRFKSHFRTRCLKLGGRR